VDSQGAAGLSAENQTPSLGIVLQLREIFAKVQFPPSTATSTERQKRLLAKESGLAGYAATPSRANPNAVAPPLECGRMHIVGENFLQFSAR